MSDNSAIAPTRKPLSAADIVSRVAQRYGDAALPSTNKQFVIVQDSDAGVLNENGRIAKESLKRLEDSLDKTPDLARNVLVAMSRIDSESTSSRAYADVGVVVLNPADMKDTPLLSNKNEMLEATITVLHELGHVNMGYLKRIQDSGGMSDINFVGSGKDFRVVNGWERDLPKELMTDLRKMLGKTDISPDSESGFKSKSDYQSYLDAVKSFNAGAPRESVDTLRSLVSETYADAFAVLSYAAKDGAAAGAYVADQLHAFRTKEASDGFSSDSHDSSRGMAWLSSYLKSPAGEKLVSNLQSAENISESAQKIHQSAKMFASLNVRRWAQDYGMPLASAEKLSKWVSDYFQKAEATSIKPTEVSRTPEVHNFSKETIQDLASKAAPKERDDNQRVMEYSKTSKLAR